MNTVRLAVSCAAGAIAVILSQAAQAQDFERVAPKELPRQPVVTAPPTPNAPATPAVNDAQVVVPALRGLVFLPSREALMPNGVATSGVVTSGIASLEDTAFKKMLSDDIGHPLTFGGLREITDAVVELYRRAGRPVVRAIVPQQNVDSGVVQIVVLEFKVGKVTVAGNRYFSDAQVIAPFHLEHGDPIDADAISGALDRANANPFRRVELVYKPSEEVGYTDLVLQTRDRLPFRPYVSYDNSGAKVTGRDRYSVGFNWGRAFGADQMLSYQFSTSRDLFDGDNRLDGKHHIAFMSHSLFYAAPTSWGDKLTIFGAYEKSDPNIGQDFDLVGESGQASIRYQHHLPILGSVRQDVQIGFDFKTTNNNLDFGGTNISRASTEVDQFLLTYTGSIPDRLGVTGISGTLVYSPGGLTGNNTTAAYQPTTTQAGRLGATADYVYFRGEIDRLTTLPGGADWTLRLVGQLSNRPLLATEQLSFGGNDTLRGYEPNSVNGDEGVMLSSELRSPVLVPFDRTTLRFLTFAEAARLSNKRPAPDQVSAFTAVSAGFGARLNVGTQVQLKADYGFQLRKLPGEQRYGQLASVSIVFGY